jgi:hypothetical protein
MPPDDVIGSDNFEDQSPNSTLSGLSPHMGSGFNRDGTVAPKIGEDEDEKEQYAQNTAELIDKRVFSGKGIPFVVILIIMGLIFIQDNYAKTLNNWKDIWWSIQKCSVFLLLYAIFLLYQLISGCWKKKK